MFYKDKTKYHNDGLRKPGASASVDLHKCRYLLLNKDKGLCSDSRRPKNIVLFASMKAL